MKRKVEKGIKIWGPYQRGRVEVLFIKLKRDHGINVVHKSEGGPWCEYQQE